MVLPWLAFKAYEVAPPVQHIVVAIPREIFVSKRLFQLEFFMQIIQFSYTLDLTAGIEAEGTIREDPVLNGHTCHSSGNISNSVYFLSHFSFKLNLDQSHLHSTQNTALFVPFISNMTVKICCLFYSFVDTLNKLKIR